MKNRNSFITVLEAVSLRSGGQRGWSLVKARLQGADCLPASHCALSWWGAPGSSVGLSIKTLIPFTRTLLSCPTHLPKPQLQTVSHWALGVQLRNFEETHTH